MRAAEIRLRSLRRARVAHWPRWLALIVVGIVAGGAYYVAITWGLLLAGRALLGW